MSDLSVSATTSKGRGWSQLWQQYCKRLWVKSANSPFTSCSLQWSSVFPASLLNSLQVYSFERHQQTEIRNSPLISNTSCVFDDAWDPGFDVLDADRVVDEGADVLVDTSFLKILLAEIPLEDGIAPTTGSMETMRRWTVQWWGIEKVASGHFADEGEIQELVRCSFIMFSNNLYL